jgi:hypothetical protein
MYVYIYIYIYIYIINVLKSTPPHRYGTAESRVSADLVAGGGVQLWGLAEFAWYVFV